MFWQAIVMAAAASAGELVAPVQLATPGAWEPVEGSPPAETTTLDGKPALKLSCPFSSLTGWRAAWDLALDADLGGFKWIRLKAKADDPEAVAGITVYFESGGGWYRDGMGAPGRDWRLLRRPRAGFGTEGKPGGWGGVRRVRIAVLPAAKRDTAVYLAGLEGTSTLTIEDAARVGPYERLEDLKEALASATASRDALARGEAALGRAARAADVTAAEPQRLIGEARGAFVDAYLAAQRPRVGELRGAWCHTGTGPGMGWTKAVNALADNGFNALFPNLLWSGVAFYPSKVVPVSPEVAKRGDQLREILAVAHARGVKVHVWKVCWQFGWMADPTIARPFRFAGRCQVDRDGRTGDWLCPSRADNRAYELEAIKELVRNYAIDGFHLDYIRYPGDEWCFCPSCRKAFEKKIGKPLMGWPAPVLEGGRQERAYRDWRREVITSFVREVRRAISKIRPGIQLSAAVFPVPESARDSVLQDWGRWIQEGLVDFVCPMNYTEDLQEMRSRAAAGLAAAAGKMPVYQGLYTTFGPDQSQSPDILAAQIVAARELGAGGFVLFELQDHVITGLLPQLRRGITAP